MENSINLTRTELISNKNIIRWSSVQAFARIGEHSVFSLVTSTSIVQICFATPPT